jgi:hypothetical protein
MRAYVVTRNVRTADLAPRGNASGRNCVTEQQVTGVSGTGKRLIIAAAALHQLRADCRKRHGNLR